RLSLSPFLGDLEAGRSDRPYAFSGLALELCDRPGREIETRALSQEVIGLAVTEHAVGDGHDTGPGDGDLVAASEARLSLVDADAQQSRARGDDASKIGFAMADDDVLIDRHVLEKAEATLVARRHQDVVA